ncbi:D-alanyl-D-alanine carboxypeptidase family protein [Metabacillus arenae]|uniref:D-alanyl-D-alanine carboxypeptidase family protein n=1 Tax=Metabacillus arenae TaxID=2771434 RepID=UPI002964F091|nr:D-alanyl-D-alanine carboxypeptidase family protein [Metabacillus arenae]
MKYSPFIFFTILLLIAAPLHTIKAAGNKPSIQSEAAVLVDAQSGQVLYEKNSEQKMYPASITKIATAIYAIENGNLSDMVTISEKARNVEGTRVYLEEGEQVPLKKLVQGLMINSGNDAGVAIAEHLSGSIKEFSKDLNAYLAEETGIQDTTFQNPHGLYNEMHMTTAKDMAKITRYAMENETFRDIFKTTKLKWQGESWDTTIFNHHKLVRNHSYKGITGGKNGFVDQAGFTLVTSASRENLNLIVVTMNAPTDQATYSDTTSLLDYGFASFETGKIKEGTIFEDSQNHEYTLDEPLYYTKRIGEEVNPAVSPSGELTLRNDEEELIASKHLEPNQQAIAQQKMLSKSAEESRQPSLLEGHLKLLILLSFGIFSIVAGYFFLQIRKL